LQIEAQGGTGPGGHGGADRTDGGQHHRDDRDDQGSLGPHACPPSPATEPDSSDPSDVATESSTSSSKRPAIAGRAIVTTTPGAISTRTVVSATSTSVPWIPAKDSTRSPTTNDATSSWCARCRCCWGRMIISQKIGMKISVRRKA